MTENKEDENLTNQKSEKSEEAFGTFDQPKSESQDENDFGNFD